MSKLDGLQTTMVDFLERGLVISPWLTGVDQKRRFHEHVFFLLDDAAQDYTGTHWTDDLRIRTFGDLPITARVPRTAFYEICASTAVWLAHGELGQTDVTETLARRSIAEVLRFCDDYDLGVLVQLYGLATQYENHQAVAYYGQIPERIFVLGQWHRPWVDYSLSDELAVGLLRGNYVLREVDGQSMVELTDKGRETFRDAAQFLTDTGYLARRVRQLHLASFNQVPDFASVAQVRLPDWVSQRREFCLWAGIEPGMTVLEVGCGDGLFTFDGGLAERVGPSGRLVAADPAASMLARAVAKGRGQGMEWVEFMQAPAEALPFPDGAFDAVVGVSFLHLTDLPRALSEMRRVVRPGGVAATFYPLPLLLDMPFLREWFAPLLALAESDLRQRPDDFLIAAEEMAQAWEEAGFESRQTRDLTSRILYWDPEVVHRFFLATSWGQEELARLPWKAREDVLAQVAASGVAVCAKYPKEERVIHTPMQMLRATAGRLESG